MDLESIDLYTLSLFLLHWSRRYVPHRRMDHPLGATKRMLFNFYFLGFWASKKYLYRVRFPNSIIQGPWLSKWHWFICVTFLWVGEP